jgi:predicted nucleic acid-binding protein
MAGWRKFFRGKEPAAAPEKPVAWVVHADDEWRGKMTDILTQKGYTVNAFERFDEAVFAYDYLEKSGKPSIKDLKKLEGANKYPYLYDFQNIHSIQKPELIVSDLYGKKSLFPKKRIPDLVNKINGKGIGHVIQSSAKSAELDPKLMLDDIEEYLGSGVPKIMRKQDMDEQEFLKLVEESIAAARQLASQNKGEEGGAWTLRGTQQSPHNGGRY